MNDLAPNRSKRRERGFSMIEMLLVVSIGIILTAMAAPSMKSSMYMYRLNSAVAMSKWAIQSTRFQALEKGYPYQVVFNAANLNYQIQNLPATCTVSGTPQTPCTTYQPVGAVVPISSWPMTVSQNTTITFQPNGYVTSAPSSSFTVTYQSTVATITVSNYGNVTTSCSNSTINPAC
jgi:prepilin-type N-terminal cleavage/methylation domain-containing protein